MSWDLIVADHHARSEKPWSRKFFTKAVPDLHGDDVRSGAISSKDELALVTVLQYAARVFVLQYAARVFGLLGGAQLLLRAHWPAW